MARRLRRAAGRHEPPGPDRRADAGADRDPGRPRDRIRDGGSADDRSRPDVRPAHAGGRARDPSGGGRARAPHLTQRRADRHLRARAARIRLDAGGHARDRSIHHDRERRHPRDHPPRCPTREGRRGHCGVRRDPQRGIAADGAPDRTARGRDRLAARPAGVVGDHHRGNRAVEHPAAGIPPRRHRGR